MPDFDYKSLAMDIGEEKKCVQGLLEGEHEDWIKLQSDRDTAWAQICCRLMERDRTELTAVVMDGPDKIQHLFWRFVDPALQPANPDPWFTRIRGLCLDFYRQLDANIERLVRAAGPDTDVIMTSDHGFGATTEVVYINEWLARHGYLRWRSSVEQGEAGKLTADRMKEHLGMVDWRNSVAYCPTPSSNAIYIKRVNGASPGVKDTEYLEFCLKLRQQLLDFRDPANGKPVFVGVDVNKLEGTPYVEPSPDITVRLRDGGFVSILKSNDIVVPREHPDGTHRPNGIFIARGPRIRRGAHTKPLNLLDIAPLLLHLLGIPIPDDLEGRVPTEVLTDTASGQHSVARGNATVATATHDGERQPTPEEREALLKQLKLLGYMD
jgi:predicted AlkP superfamily phosphohydrolase/phosphomutase